MAKPLLGMRVVRGPDWLPFCNDDGGQGGVGTVIEIVPCAHCEGGNEKASTAAIASGGAASVQDGQVMVHWDITGNKGTYNCGAEGSYELRILDTTPAGICHAGVSCTECGREEIAGIRWQCRECPDSNLCTDCYTGSEHDIDHRFCAIAYPGAANFFAARRNSSTCVMSKGIFPRSRVSVTSHGLQGHDNPVGTVSKPSSTCPPCDRGTVAVEWQDSRTTRHSLGHDGKVDLSCVQPSDGGCYYSYHHPMLGALNSAEITCMQRVGDLVQVLDMDSSIVRDLQDEVDGKHYDITEFRYEIGEVKFIDRTRDGVNISFPSRRGLHVFHPAVCAEVCLFRTGQRVTVMADMPSVRDMMKPLGGWTGGADIAVGSEGIVAEMQHDFSLLVQFDERSVYLHPACLVPASTFAPVQTAAASSSSAEDGLTNIANFLHQAGATVPNVADAHAVVHQATSNFLQDAASGNIDWTSLVRSVIDPGNQHSIPPQLLNEAVGTIDHVFPSMPAVKAMFEGDSRKLEAVLQAGIIDVNEVTGEDKCTLLHLAVDVGRVDFIELLCRFGGDVNSADRLGELPLHYAVKRDCGEVVECLIRLGAKIDVPGHEGNFPLHVASNSGSLVSVNIIAPLHKERGFDIDCMNAKGNTPLHAAVLEDYVLVVQVLVENGASIERASLSSDLNTCQIATGNNSYNSLAYLLERAPNLATHPRCPMNGDTLLHMAAENNYFKCLQVILSKGDCDLEATNHLGGTALRTAVTTGSKSCVEHFVTATDASLSALDQDGNSLLHVALYRQQHAEAGDEDDLVDAASQLSNPSPSIDAIQEKMAFITNSGNRMAAIACYLAQHGCNLSQLNWNNQEAISYAGGEQMRSLVREYYRPPMQAPITSNKRSAGVKVAITTVQANFTADNCPSNPVQLPCFEETSDVVVLERPTAVQHGMQSFTPDSSSVQAAEGSPSRTGVIQCVRRCGNIATVTFLPCGHKVTCKACSVYFQKCRVCRHMIHHRQDNGSDLLADSSQIAMLSSVSLSRAKTKTVCKMAARFPGKKQPVSLRTAVVQSSPQNYVSRVSSGTPKSEVIRTSPSSSSNAASKDDGDFNSLREDGAYLKRTAKLVLTQGSDGHECLEQAEAGNSHSVISKSDADNILKVPKGDAQPAEAVQLGLHQSSPGNVPVPPNSPDAQARLNAMLSAIATQDTVCLENLLQCYRDLVNCVAGTTRSTCMHAAVSTGVVAIVEMVAKYGGRVDIRNSLGDLPLHSAAMKDFNSVIAALVRLGAKLDEPGQGSCIPLQMASANGNLAAAKELIRQHKLAGVDIDTTDMVGKTALYFATVCDRPFIVRELLDASANMELILAPKNLTACQTAAAINSAQSLSVMVQHSPELIKSSRKLDSDFSLVHLAAHENAVDSLKVLITQLPSSYMELRSDYGGTPLREAVVSGAADAVEMLVAYGADLHTEDVEGNSLIHCAFLKMAKSERGDGKFTSVDHGAPLIKEIQKEMPYSRETSKRMAAIACFLAQQGCDLNYVNHKGNTAIQNADDVLVPILLRYSSPAGTSKFPGSKVRQEADTAPDGEPQHSTAIAGAASLTVSQQVAKPLIASGEVLETSNPSSAATRPDLVKTQGSRKTRPAHTRSAGMEGLQVILPDGGKLLDNSAMATRDSSASCEPPPSPRQLQHGLSSSAQLSVGNSRLQSDTSASPTAPAVPSGIRASVDIISEAIRDLDLVQLESVLQQQRAHVNDTVGGTSLTCMHIAVLTGIVATVEMVFNYGGRLDIGDSLGDKPLHLAVMRQHDAVVDCLCRLGAKIDDVGQHGKLPIHQACLQEHEPTLLAVINQHKQAGVDIDVLSGRGNSALMVAVDSDHPNVVQQLLSAGANLFLKLPIGECTVFQRAVMNNRYRALPVLLQHSPECISSHVTDKDGWTLLHLAAKSNSVDCLHLLLRQPGCDIDARDFLLTTPLVACTAVGALDCIEQLIAYGADVNTVDLNGQTLLHSLLGAMQRLTEGVYAKAECPILTNRTTESAPQLLELINSMPNDGEWSKLFAAIAVFLAQQGCDLTKRNLRGEVPLQCTDDARLVQLVLDNHAPPGSSTFHGSKASELGSAVATTSQRQRTASSCRAGSDAARSTNDLSSQSSMEVDVSVPMRSSDAISEVVKCCTRSCTNTAVVKFHPCGHQVTCQGCSTQFNMCGTCGSIVERRDIAGLEPLSPPLPDAVLSLKKQCQNIQECTGKPPQLVCKNIKAPKT